ncbi:hypothetical protein EJD97_006342, partial [Solanum chilense]
MDYDVSPMATDILRKTLKLQIIVRTSDASADTAGTSNVATGISDATAGNAATSDFTYVDAVIGIHSSVNASPSEITTVGLSAGCTSSVVPRAGLSAGCTSYEGPRAGPSSGNIDRVLH